MQTDIGLIKFKHQEHANEFVNLSSSGSVLVRTKDIRHYLEDCTIDGYIYCYRKKNQDENMYQGTILNMDKMIEAPSRRPFHPLDKCELLSKEFFEQFVQDYPDLFL